MVEDNWISICGKDERTHRERRSLSYRKGPPKLRNPHGIERSISNTEVLESHEVLESENVLMVEPACKGWNETLGKDY